MLRYLKTAREHGIMYEACSGDMTIGTFTDVNWGSNIDDKRSVSGAKVMVRSAPVVFKSKYHRSVALSSAGAEYKALSLCTQEVLWTRAMLKDMNQEKVRGTLVCAKTAPPS